MLDKRFWNKVNKTDTCWLWTAGKNSLGYGKFRFEKESRLSHRLSYIEKHGQISEGLVLDHLCREPSCVNPDHLEAVTQTENLYRGNGWSGRHKRKTHCKNGHEFTKENTYIRNNKWRDCKRCRADTEKRRRDRIRQNLP